MRFLIPNILPLVVVTLFFCTSVCNAQSLVITDCQGFTRAVKKVDAGDTSSVEIQLTELSGAVAIDGTVVTLTNQATGKARESKVKDGGVRFSEVGSGVYALEVADKNKVVGLITIDRAPVGLLGSTAALAGAGVITGGALIGGGVLVDQVIKRSNGGNTGKAQPTPVPTLFPSAVPTVGIKPTFTPVRPRPTVVATPTSDCPQCDPSAIPPPIRSPFPGALPAKQRSGVNHSSSQPLSPFN